MKLLLDIGNSRLKWALSAEKHSFQQFGAMPTQEKALPYFFEDISFHYPIKNVWVANVLGPHYQNAVLDWWQQNKNLTPQFIAAKQDVDGLKISYQAPEKFGVDRFLALLAARQLTTNHICCIDCGTALTIDVVTAQGIHQGGHILPGLRLFSTLLQDNTLGCQIKKQKAQYDLVLADNTRDAMQNGALSAIVAYLNAMSKQLLNSYPDIHFYLTGGDAETILPHLQETMFFEPMLVLQGINYFSTVSAQ